MLRAGDLNRRLRAKRAENGETRIDVLTKFAEYHRKAMESRRTVAFQALVALFALDGAIFVKADELLKHTAYVLETKILISAFAVSVFLGFLFTMFAIRTRNEKDRQKYTILESQAWRLIDEARWKVFFNDFVGKEEGFVPSRKWWQSFREEWASSESIFLAFLLLLAVLYYVWLIGV
jgi:uncharacterized membrane protein YesL